MSEIPYEFDDPSPLSVEALKPLGFREDDEHPYCWLSVDAGQFDLQYWPINTYKRANSHKLFIVNAYGDSVVLPIRTVGRLRAFLFSVQK